MPCIGLAESLDLGVQSLYVFTTFPGDSYAAGTASCTPEVNMLSEHHVLSKGNKTAQSRKCYEQKCSLLHNVKILKEVTFKKHQQGAWS